MVSGDLIEAGTCTAVQQALEDGGVVAVVVVGEARGIARRAGGVVPEQVVDRRGLAAADAGLERGALLVTGGVVAAGAAADFQLANPVLALLDHRQRQRQSDLRLCQTTGQG